MRHGYGIRNSVPYGMASIVRPSLRTSLTSLRSEHENGSIASTSPENFGQRGGFALDVSDDCTSDLESTKSTTMRRNEGRRQSRTLMGGFRSKRRKDRSGTGSGSGDNASVASLRHNLKHQDSLKSNESTMSTSSVQSSCFESEMGHMQEEEASHDVTEVYMGEWKQDKRAGYGTSQRSDGYQYAGEWHNNKRHGYGCLTYPNGHKEEGKWKQNMLVASGKKKLFVIGSKKISDRVERAVELAGQAANIARQKADLAISRAAYAKEKAEMADVAAAEAREESIKARSRAKELASTLPPRGNILCSPLKITSTLFL
ncbi:junctophilin-2-like [Diadema antillarum]|uniref:junctophilin-2-like n=1 Tax=Diadema antillarum TaxID=105358 RepID=UPI003A8838FC